MFSKNKVQRPKQHRPEKGRPDLANIAQRGPKDVTRFFPIIAYALQVGSGTISFDPRGLPAGAYRKLPVNQCLAAFIGQSSCESKAFEPSLFD